jgi:hypothetical protein
MGARARRLCVAARLEWRERVCARRPEPDKGMRDADVWLDHKAILNMGKKYR